MNISTVESQKMIRFMSSDGKTFEVEEAVAVKWTLIQCMIEDKCADDIIPLPNVTSKILSKVIEYCKHHVDATAKAEATGATVDEEINTFDADFVKVDLDTLYDLMSAASYLEIESLLDLTCQSVADMVKGKSPEEIREIFGIQNDFSDLEEFAVRARNYWAFPFWV